MRQVRRFPGNPNSAATMAGCHASGTGIRQRNLSAAAELGSRIVHGSKISRQAIRCWALLLLTLVLCGCAGFDAGSTPRRHRGLARPDWLPRPTVWRPLEPGGVDCGVPAWNGSPDAMFSSEPAFFSNATSLGEPAVFGNATAPGETTFSGNTTSPGETTFSGNAASSPAAKSSGEAAAGEATVHALPKPEFGRPFPLPASAPGSTSRLGDDGGGMKEPDIWTPEPVVAPIGDPVPRSTPPAELSPAPISDPAVPTTKPTTTPAVVPRIESPISVEQPPMDARPASLEVESTVAERDVPEESTPGAPAASAGVFYPEP